MKKGKVQFLAEQTSNIHEEEQHNLVAIFFVSSCSVGIRAGTKAVYYNSNICFHNLRTIQTLEASLGLD